MTQRITKNFDESSDLNSPNRFNEIRKFVLGKAALKYLYLETYKKYQEAIDKSPPGYLALEIGSGAGFAKDIIPSIITSDVIPYPGIDRVLDATKIDLEDNSVSCICMFNVLHHIPNTPEFFQEAYRCLVPGGRIMMVEPYPGWIGAFIYRYLHHFAIAQFHHYGFQLLRR